MPKANRHTAPFLFMYLNSYRF